MATTPGLVQCAANSPEELAFLRAIVASPADDLPRLVYADWLEERADPRGRLLRDCVTASRADGEFPDLGDAPAPWADLTGLSVLASLARAGLLKHRDELLQHARPALRIRLEKPLDEVNYDSAPPPPPQLGTTRLGGAPDLPAGEPYPTAADGVPLHFLGQFDLADFDGTVSAALFPDSGPLSVFRPGSFIYCPESADLPRLVRLATPGTPLARTPHPAGWVEPPAPYRPELSLVETLRVPHCYEKWPGVSMTEFLDELAYSYHDSYLLLGHSFHCNTGEEPLRGRPDLVQLIHVPCTEGPDFGVADISFSYQLPAADLKAGRFDCLESGYG